MKSVIYAATAAAAFTGALAAPSTPKSKRQMGADCSAVSLSGNAFAQYEGYANSYYAAEVEAAVEQISDPDLAAAAARVADIPTFMWLDTRAKIDILEPELQMVPCDEIIGLVIYDLPGRDCAAKASNGELSYDQIDVYRSEYIDPIAEIISRYPGIPMALVIEPDSLPNLVTNADLQTCQDSASAYREGVAYALEQLNFDNVVMYLDAGHGGWLGWDDNLEPGAQEIADAYQRAGSPSQVMGVASNVAGWNAFSMNPGEFANADDAQWNSAQDEQRYAELFSPLLEQNGMPGQFIVDTGRNAVQGLRDEWGDWCNVDGAGFGVRPTSDTGDSNVDAFVWVKPGGESDGTSDTSADRYDSYCGKPDAFKPSPEAGTWNQEYFEMLVRNADPPL
ncbi:glycoside hydrolase family 6 protein [Lineolata rhizophorae]|uniref:Glucanase n=1 Tax=Lineolata rhizophorae TaxID=578093 RepID=A0A6A6PBQ2_9PEZI|nr:glycoside hydrolase family 6 protein [Lineolata rhizophorae]